MREHRVRTWNTEYGNEQVMKGTEYRIWNMEVMKGREDGR